MKKASVVMNRLRSAAGFTLVELIAAVALLVILLSILMVVFRAAGSTVSIGQDRLERDRALRAIFRLLEEDITNAFLMTEGTATYGFAGDNEATAAFLVDDSIPGGFPPSDHLTLIRPRRAPKDRESPFADEPGFMVIRYSRFTYERGQELAGGRRHCFFRAVDDKEGVSWNRGDPFLPALFSFSRSDPDPTDDDNNAYYRNHIAVLGLTDLQFEYLKIDPDGEPIWQDEWDLATDTYDPDGPGGVDAQPSLPLEVRVTIRLPRGSAYRGSSNPDDHQTFTHVVHLSTAPWAP